jgi:hypothetical protein
VSTLAITIRASTVSSIGAAVNGDGALPCQLRPKPAVAADLRLRRALKRITCQRQKGAVMGSRETSLDVRERELDGEIERYREAATTALEQLEWVVGYLNRIRKPEIAGVLDRNRRHIREGIR